VFQADGPREADERPVASEWVRAGHAKLVDARSDLVGIGLVVGVAVAPSDEREREEGNAPDHLTVVAIACDLGDRGYAVSKLTRRGSP
jgi:hypothetical protein